MNKTQQIEILDMPRCLRSGFISLQPVGPDPSIENGNIISEVGEPTLFTHPSYFGSFLSYNLRGKRKCKIPKHIFGKINIGDAYSAFLPRVVALPAIGTTVLLQPRITPEQDRMISNYRYVRGDVTWIIHIPSPLGVGALVEIFAPEVDSRTQTRGVRFRPSGVNTISVTCPWSSDISVVERSLGRIGQSGGAIALRTVEDNTIGAVNTPLNVTIYQVAYNIWATGLIPSASESIGVPGLNFVSSEIIPSVAPVMFVEHGGDEEASTEVNAEGIGNIPEQIALDSTPASVISVPVEQPVGQPITTASKRSTRNQQGQAGARWFELDNLTLNSEELLSWVKLSVDPYKLGRRGENISRAYKRNVWVSGSSTSGVVRTMKIKVVIARSPQISGIVEFADSYNDSSRYLVEFGGNVEFDLIPRNFSSFEAKARPRYYNSHFLRTNEAQCDYRYRITAFNRTADIADVKVRVLARAGNAYFDVPTKPKAQTTTLSWLVNLLETYTEMKDYSLLLNTTYDYLVEHGGEEAIVPLPGNIIFDGEIEEGHAFEEEIEQDEYAVNIWNGDLPTGQLVTIPVNLSVIQDFSGTGAQSTIGEKFERFAHIVPTEAGNLGPQIGTYTIQLRLPTTISGSISHVSIPGDMSDEVALYAFGLGDILSMATTALQAVGGPVINAGIAAGRAVFNLIKSIGGDDNEKSKSDSSEQPMLSGPMDISRFVNFVKEIAQNEVADPVFGSILMQARDFIGANGEAIEKIPASIWAKMTGTSVERSLFDRLVTPATTVANVVSIPYDRFSYIVDVFGQHQDTFTQGTFQNKCFKQFMTVLRQKGAKQEVTSLTLSEILACEVTQEDEDLLQTFMSAEIFAFRP